MDSNPAPPLRNLRDDEIEAYRRDGAIKVSGLMQAEWFERIERAVVKVMKAPTPISGVFSAPDEGFHMEAGLFVSDDDIRAVVYESPMARVAMDLMGSQKIHFFYDQMFCKKPGNQHLTPWHHDLTFWPVEGDQICSMWIPLDSVTKESSGLEFVLGSHRWKSRFKAVSPMYNEQLMDPEHEDVPDIESNRGDYEIASWSVEPGEILIFHPLTLHGSGANYHLDRERRALAFRWLGDDVRYCPTMHTMPFQAPGLEYGAPIAEPGFAQVIPLPEERPQERPEHRPRV
jgi:hypothetical protein